MQTTNLLEKLQKLYALLPEVACRGCGLCCVSPTCTPVEFLSLLKHISEKLSSEQVANFLFQSPEIHPDYEGNIRCAFLDSTRCAIHQGRTGACRLFGVPSLSALGIPGLVECRNEISVLHGEGDENSVREWLGSLAALNQAIPGFDCEPFFLRGLNLACWFDIYFDSALDIDIFEDLRTIMWSIADFSDIKPNYVPRTNIREKIDKISILSLMLDTADAPAIRKLLCSIRDDYPLTGSYFYEEAQAYLDAIQTQEHADLPE